MPSSEALNSGSKLNFLVPMDMLNIAAGFPNEKVGMKEIPLLVVLMLPEKWYSLFGVTSVWAKVDTKVFKNMTNRTVFNEKCWDVIFMRLV